MHVLAVLGLLSNPSSAADYDPKLPVWQGTPEDLDKWLDNLGDLGPGTGIQFAPDTTELWSPADPKTGFPQLAGHLSTQFETQEWPYGDVTETWVVYNPDVTLAGQLDAHYVGATPGGILGIEAHYAAQPNASMYRVLQFDFTYELPLTPQQVAQAPSFVPWFVTNVYQFEVYTVIDGNEKRSGSLYRQRVVWGGFVSWWDEWVLFDTYEMPESAQVVTRMKPTGAPTVPLRTWLEQQPPFSQKAFVHTTAGAFPL